MSEIVKRQRYHAEIFFSDKKSPRITLLIRDIVARRTLAGRISITMKDDALTFESEEEMAEAIKEQRMVALKESHWRSNRLPAKFGRLQRKERP